MEQLVVAQFNRLPKHLQEEVLHYIQFLLQRKKKTIVKSVKSQKKSTPTFADFNFSDRGQTYSRMEIYGDDGR